MFKWTVIRKISEKKNEPQWLLDYRLNAFKICRKWPNRNGHVHYDKPKFQDISYFSAPKKKYESWDDVDPEMKATMNKLGISMTSQKKLTGVAVDFVMDSVSVATSFKRKIRWIKYLFCSFSEAVENHPELVKKYLGTVVPTTDNFYAALILRCSLMVHFVIFQKAFVARWNFHLLQNNQSGTGQFERHTFSSDEKLCQLSWRMHGASARRNQLHAAVVELIALDGAEIKYSTWYKTGIRR